MKVTSEITPSPRDEPCTPPPIPPTPPAFLCEPGGEGRLVGWLRAAAQQKNPVDVLKKNFDLPV